MEPDEDSWRIANPEPLALAHTGQALFLDRDGVVNVDRHYVSKAADIEFMPGIFELCRAAIKLRMLPIIITNQSGIGRGIFSTDALHELTQWMFARFAAERAPIACLYYCPTHPTEGLDRWRVESQMRKPAPGMFLRAIGDWDLDPDRCLSIGDRARDAQAAVAAGIATTLHVDPSLDRVADLPPSTTVVPDLLAAIPLLGSA